MSKKTLYLLLAFVVLGSSAWWFVSRNNSSSLTGGDYDFSVADTASVTKIFLADRSNHQITLVREGNHWIVNGKSKARPRPVQNLLWVFKNITLKYRLPRAAVPTAVKNLASNGVLVKVYTGGDKPYKSFYVGGPTPDERGNYMIMEGSNEPYVCHLTGYDGNLYQMFFSQEHEWRDRTVFGEDAGNIKEVAVEYPAQKEKSFKIVRNDGGFQVEPFFPSMPKSLQPYRKGSVESYLVGYGKIIAENFENTNPYRDSISNLPPHAVIHLTDMAGTQKTVRLHPIVSRDKENKPIISDLTGMVVIERYFANCSWGDFMLLQEQNVGKLLMPYQYFFGSNK